MDSKDDQCVVSTASCDLVGGYSPYNTLDSKIFTKIFDLAGSIPTNNGILPFITYIPWLVIVSIGTILLGFGAKNNKLIVEIINNIFKWIFIKIFINVHEYDNSDIKHINYWIHKELYKLSGTHLVNYIPIHLSNEDIKDSTKNNIKLYVFKWYHNNYIHQLTNVAQNKKDEYESNQLDTEHLIFVKDIAVTNKKYDFKITPTNQVYKSKNHTKILSTIENHVTFCKKTKNYNVLGIKINSKPGYGKSYLSHSIVRSGLVDKVYHCDLTHSSLIDQPFNDIITEYFTKVNINDKKVFIIDEMDKYFDYSIKKLYSSTVNNKSNSSNNNNNNTNVNLNNNEDYDKFVVSKRMDYLYIILNILERRGLGDVCVVIFCSNNFSSIYDGVDMTHFQSLNTRFVEYEFEECDYNEVTNFLKYNNDLLVGTKLHNECLYKILLKLRKNISISYRDLCSKMVLSHYDFDKTINAINNTDGINKNISIAGSLINIDIEEENQINEAIKQSEIDIQLQDVDQYFANDKTE